MSEKRYQIFISSTFTDLEEERKSIIEAILNLDCFPSGMEMFPACDMQQFEYIKTIIAESDYYVLVVAGKYGSMSGETGISYTEMEYDYAIEKRIPVITFVKKDIDLLIKDKIEVDLEKQKKLIEFRAKISQNRLVKLWDDSKDLKYAVLDSLSKAIKIHKRVGWIKGDTATDTKLLRQLNDLRSENDELKKSLSNDDKNDLHIKSDINKENLSQANDEYKIDYDITYNDYNYYKPNEVNTINLTWNDLFYALGYELLEGSLNTKGVKQELNRIIGDKILDLHQQGLSMLDNYEDDSSTIITIFDQNLTIILLQLVHLNLLEDNFGHFLLTEEGRKKIVNSLLVKKDN